LERTTGYIGRGSTIIEVAGSTAQDSVLSYLWVKATDFGVTKEVLFTQRLVSTEDGLEFQVGPVGSLLTQLAKS
jgi:hypothetical protein